MKKYIITFDINGDYGEKVESKDLPDRLGKQFAFFYNNMEVSDGYHTMDELYDHRIELYIALAKAIASRNPAADELGEQKQEIWRARTHLDGFSYAGWFLLGIGKEKGKTITYHLPNARWDDCDFAETLERAPEWDGHTSADVLNRLKTL